MISFTLLLSESKAKPWTTVSNGPSKTSIVDFVECEGQPEYVNPEELIAIFDHDGTLWAEQPICFQIMFAMDRVQEMALKHPDWKTIQPVATIVRSLL